MGTTTVAEALEVAKKKGLDLIEIAPQAEPPVVRIYDYDKFRYQKEKEEKKKKKQQKGKRMKQLRITPRAALNDLETKAKKVAGFLKAGYRVEINIFLQGREKTNKDFALRKLEEFLDMIKEPYEKTMEPKYSGRGYSVQIIKK